MQISSSAMLTAATPRAQNGVVPSGKTVRGRPWSAAIWFGLGPYIYETDDHIILVTVSISPRRSYHAVALWCCIARPFVEVRASNIAVLAECTT